MATNNLYNQITFFNLVYSAINYLFNATTYLFSMFFYNPTIKLSLYYKTIEYSNK